LDVKYPHWRKRWRTTLWKKTGITRNGERVWLARARGVAPLAVLLPPTLLALPAAAFLEVRLVWDRAAQHYSWHVVVEDGVLPLPAPGTSTAAVDLGEIHPAALTDGKQTVIISCRALRANHQYTTKRLAAIRAKQDRKKKHSRSWNRLQRRKTRFLAKQRRRARDLEHKISRAVVTWPRSARWVPW
jgi:putative transposase